MTSIAELPESTSKNCSPIPGIVELRSGTSESIVRRPASPEASKEEVRVGSSLCVDHLCGCKK